MGGGRCHPQARKDVGERWNADGGHRLLPGRLAIGSSRRIHGHVGCVLAAVRRAYRVYRVLTVTASSRFDAIETLRVRIFILSHMSTPGSSTRTMSTALARACGQGKIRGSFLLNVTRSIPRGAVDCVHRIARVLIRKVINALQLWCPGHRRESSAPRVVRGRGRQERG